MANPIVGTDGYDFLYGTKSDDTISGLANGAGSRLWWTYAFLLGTVSAFNPCGFALIPAYLGLYLNDPSIRDACRAVQLQSELFSRTEKALDRIGGSR